MSIGSAKDLPCNAAMEAPDLNYPRPLPSWLAESSKRAATEALHEFRGALQRLPLQGRRDLPWEPGGRVLAARL